MEKNKAGVCMEKVAYLKYSLSQRRPGGEMTTEHGNEGGGNGPHGHVAGEHPIGMQKDGVKVETATSFIFWAP